jgi:hypothetical protein
MDPILTLFFGGGTGPKTTGSSFLAGTGSPSDLRGEEEERRTIFVRFEESRSESAAAWMLAMTFSAPEFVFLACFGFFWEEVVAGCVDLGILVELEF